MTNSLLAGRRGRTIALAGCAGLAIATSSCGGHHNSANLNTSVITATIDWPAQSRDISGVSSAAVACIITAESGDPNNGDDPIDFTPVLRPAIAAGQSQTTLFSSGTVTVNPGVRKFQIRFYNTLPTGTTNSTANDTIATSYAAIPSVGDATVSVTVAVPTTDLGAVTMTGTIGSLSIPAVDQSTVTVDFGNTTTIAATAYTTGGTVIAIPSGAVFYSAPSNPAFTLNQNGDLTTTGLGTALVTASTQLTTGALTNTTPPVPIDGPEVTTTSNVSSIVGVNRLTTQANGVMSADTVAGTAGTGATSSSAVKVQYTGYYTNDASNNLDSGSYVTFDTANGAAPVALNLGNGSVPTGLVNAIVGMNVGGTRIVVVPYAQTNGLGIPSSAPAQAPAIYIISRTQ